MTEVRAESLDVLAGVEEHGRVEVPQRVYSVLAGCLVPLVLIGLWNHTGLDEGGFPYAGVEVGPEHGVAGIGTLSLPSTR